MSLQVKFCLFTKSLQKVFVVVYSQLRVACQVKFVDDSLCKSKEKRKIKKVNSFSLIKDNKTGPRHEISQSVVYWETMFGAEFSFPEV